MLHLNAVQIMKGVLASTATKKLQDVLETAFDKGDEESNEALEAEEEEDDEEEG